MATVSGGWGSRKRRLWGFAAVVVAVAYRLPVASHPAGVDPEAVDKAFALFWAAEDPTQAASRIEAVVASEWAARDNDRTALFGASIQIEVTTLNPL